MGEMTYYYHSRFLVEPLDEMPARKPQGEFFIMKSVGVAKPSKPPITVERFK